MKKNAIFLSNNNNSSEKIQNHEENKQELYNHPIIKNKRIDYLNFDDEKQEDIRLRKGIKLKL